MSINSFRHLPPLPPENVPPEPDQYVLADAEVREAKILEGGFGISPERVTDNNTIETVVDPVTWKEAQGDWNLYDRLMAVRQTERLVMQRPDDTALRELLATMQTEVSDWRARSGITTED